MVVTEGTVSYASNAGWVRVTQTNGFSTTASSDALTIGTTYVAANDGSSYSWPAPSARTEAKRLTEQGPEPTMPRLQPLVTKCWRHSTASSRQQHRQHKRRQFIQNL